MNNPVSWFEIATKDLERAKTFYHAVFNSEFQFIEMPDTKMYMFNGGAEAPGAMGALIEGADNTPNADGSLIYFSSEDVAIEAGKVEAAGGQLLFPKTSIGEFGFISQFIDSEGNRIGLHSNQ